jgi:hypothetical protein
MARGERRPVADTRALSLVSSHDPTRAEIPVRGDDRDRTDAEP